MTPEARQAVLSTLAKLLREQPLSAREVAEKMGCSLPVAYDRIRGLIARGDRVNIRKPKQYKKTGPVPTLYKIK